MDIYRLDEKIAGLVKKSKQTGIPYGILKKSYDRGMVAWKGGHRPGHYSTTMGICKSELNGNWRKTDPDLQKQASLQKRQRKKRHHQHNNCNRNRHEEEGIKPKNVQEWFESNRTRCILSIRHGDDWWWKLNEVHDAMLEKIGADCCDDCGEELNEKSSMILLDLLLIVLLM